MFDLNEKKILVVGGAGYLGSDICRGLVEQRAHLIAADVKMDAAQSLTKELVRKIPGASCEAVELNVTDEPAVTQLMQWIREKHGSLDALVNLAYCPHSKGVGELSGAEFGDALESNVGKAFHLAREAKALMKPGSSMILFSSMYGSVSPDPRIYAPPMKPNAIEYGVSKAGIEQMVRYLAVAWAPDGIRVNSVSPGPFPHAGLQKENPAFIKRLADRVPLGRIGKQHEISGAVAFLVSDEASYITGHVLMVDGGWTAW